ncbi:MAG: type II toxin-antitoxin system RelE/ParE family toxin, partial [Polyangiales bacterium]
VASDWPQWRHALHRATQTSDCAIRLSATEINAHVHCKSVGDGVLELRVHDGPGYRVYFAVDGDVVVLLLCGGDKRSQESDIVRAKSYWKEYRNAGRSLPQLPDGAAS